jgi:hypothetical protein
MSSRGIVTRSVLALALVTGALSGLATLPALATTTAEVADPTAVAALVGSMNGAIAKVKPNAPAIAYQRALVRTIKKSKASKAVIAAAIRLIKLQGNLPAGLRYALEALGAYYGNGVTGGISTGSTGSSSATYGLGNINNNQGNGPGVIGGGSENYGSH